MHRNGRRNDVDLDSGFGTIKQEYSQRDTQPHQSVQRVSRNRTSLQLNWIMRRWVKPDSTPLQIHHSIPFNSPVGCFFASRSSFLIKARN
jgi:hypothetical protein